MQLSAAFLGCDLQRHVVIPVRSNGGNVGDPVQISGGRVGAPKQSSVNRTHFLRRYFLFFRLKDVAIDYNNKFITLFK